MGNAILEPAASVFLPIAGSTQAALALFEQADAIFQQQRAELGMMDTQADTQMQRAMSTALDRTQAGYHTNPGFDVGGRVDSG